MTGVMCGCLWRWGCGRATLPLATKAGRWFPRPRDGTRPLPLVAVDRSLAADDGTLQDRATAEAQRLAAGLTFGWIEATANLGVELYDVITVDATDARVVKIVETWDRGRLLQRLELAEVNSYGIYVG